MTSTSGPTDAQAPLPTPAQSPLPAADEAVVGPLDRGLSVLRAMSAPSEHRLRPSDLVRATGLARATVDRVVSTLVHLGYLRQAGRDVELTPRLLELGNAYLSACGIPDTLGPIADRLAAEFDESLSLAVPDGDGVRFVTRVSRRRTMSLAFRIGDLLPAERCAPGALFAKEWTEQQWSAWRARLRADPCDASFSAVPTRTSATVAETAEADFGDRVTQAAARGWSADNQLVEPGLIAVAVPVADPSGRTVCAVSVVSHISRHTVESLAAAVLPRLRDEAAAMERALAEAVTQPGGRAAPDSAPPDNLTAKQELGAGFLQSLARGLAVLASLNAAGGRTLSEVAYATDLPRATARRALLSLEQLGYVEVDGRRFRPLPRVLELGYAHLSGLSLTQIVQPHLERLVGEVHESASMTVLDGDDIRYVARIPTYRIMSVDITVGTRFPAYATSMGRVLLAGLDETERLDRLSRADLRPLTSRTVTDPAALAQILRDTATDGYALVNEELDEGLRSLAVPVRDAAGTVVAAVNVSTHTGRGSIADTLATLLPALRRAAARIEADLRAVSARTPLRMP
ncbi:helix-turn-helix domain-containing protein [Planosporangium flavigriseum]|uniref:Transcriptional regulator n=1 Tax=Planosporangium flavigriseum TaxID=373681 RepID=A0A8J3PPK9_9ACTN|nr:IclR family transcriptional regulator C-terminal domain-containing protein [Planosporangium flavigriseum]NJC67731.1 helix-turn-helix domain-containing protein [Planosporangium flavigriseum]GIG76008.1 transcriptional regulator [Planosporangium flavigriseum]